MLAGIGEADGGEGVHTAVDAVQERPLVRGEPPRAVDREVERHEEGAAGDRQLPVIEQVVVAGEGGGADLRHPDLDVERLRRVDDRQLVADLVLGDDGAPPQPGALLERGPLEEQVDAGHLEVLQEDHVVDVAVGVHVRPPHGDLHRVPHGDHLALPGRGP